MGKHAGKDEQQAAQELADSFDAQWNDSVARGEEHATNYPALQNYENQQKDKK